MVEDGGRRRGWLPGWSCPFSSTTSSVQVHLGLGHEGGGEGGRGCPTLHIADLMETYEVFYDTGHPKIWLGLRHFMKSGNYRVVF